MGRNNQKRRADKKRREDRRTHETGRASAGPRRASGPSFAGELDAWRVETLVVRGATAAANGEASEVAAAAEAITRCAARMTPSKVTGLVGSACVDLLPDLWRGGWQPLEVARVVRRRRSGRHVDLLAAALSSGECWVDARGATMPGPWADQLAELGGPPVGGTGRDWLGEWMGSGERATAPFVEALAVVLETCGVLLTLPRIEMLLPPPAEWRTSGADAGRYVSDDPVLVKVRALLAKAESTGFEAESDALTAKAQELMARHAIEEAVARAGSTRREAPVTRRIAVDDPYAEAKSQLLAVVAQANDVRCIWYDGFAMMAVVGFAADLDAVEVLFTSLLVQASRAMLAKGKVTDGRGRSRTRSFRQSFLIAFASRVGERLAMAAADARLQAEQEMATSLSLVLAGRAGEIDDEMRRVFPHTRPVQGPSATNHDGWHAGRVAAEMATLGTEQGVLDGMVAAG